MEEISSFDYDLHEGTDKRLVLLFHGLFSDKDHCFLPALADALSGVVGVARCNFRSVSSRVENTYTQDVAQMRAYVDYFTQQGFEVVCIAGHSKAGSAVLLFGQHYNDVPYLVNISGRVQMSRGVERHFSSEQLAQLEKEGSFLWTKHGKTLRITQEYFRERQALQLALSMIQSSVLTVHGDTDVLVPVEDAQYCDKVIARNTLRIIAGADHNFTQREQLLCDSIVSWLDEQLDG